MCDKAFGVNVTHTCRLTQKDESISIKVIKNGKGGKPGAVVASITLLLTMLAGKKDEDKKGLISRELSASLPPYLRNKAGNITEGVIPFLHQANQTTQNGTTKKSKAPANIQPSKSRGYRPTCM